MREFLLFLRSGKTNNEKTYFNDFIILFSIVFIIGFSISFLKGMYFDINMVDEEIFEKLNWESFLNYVFIFPIIEEIIFRAPLLVPKAKIYSILISIVIFFLVVIFIDNEYYKLGIISLIVILEFVYLKNNRFKNFINNFIDNKYLIIVILSSVSFGLLHMWNYEKIDFSSLISIIGRIIAGFYFAFIVTKYDLKSSCFLHGLNNTIPFLILLMMEK